MLIVAFANLFGWILTTEQVPVRFSEWIFTISENKIVILLIINLFLLVLGCVMEILAIMLMTVPVFLPLVVELGLDPVHFGIIMVLNLMIGLLTPPFGLSLDIAQDVAGVSYSRAVRFIIPYIALMLVLLMVITFVPEFVMFLPNLI